MELEEESQLIPSFQKKFRAVYVSTRSSKKHPSAQEEAPTPIYGAQDVYEVTQGKHVRAQPNAIFEFAIDVYAVLWQNTIRTVKDSALTAMFRLFNRKRFSQKTNDLRGRAVLDFMAAPSGSETSDLLLFGKVIGLQPRQNSSPRPAWYDIRHTTYDIRHTTRTTHTYTHTHIHT
jgi:hypothetical protein